MAQATATAPVALAKRQRTARSRRSTEILDLFPRQGQWTEADYLALPETNRIIELSEGRVVIPDMPTTSHQRAVVELLFLMKNHVQTHDLGEVCVAPLRVRLWPGKFREPDIDFMHRDHADRIGEEYWGVPDLIVEVVSPRLSACNAVSPAKRQAPVTSQAGTPQSSDTEHTDRGEKFVEYAQAGVQEYWLMNPTACTIEVYVLRDGVYHLLDRWGKGEVAQSDVLDGFEVPVEAVVQEG